MANVNHDYLVDGLFKHMGINKDWDQSETGMALKNEGIHGIVEFLSLAEMDFYKLRIPAQIDGSGNIVPERTLPIYKSRCLMIFASFLHDIYREKGIRSYQKIIAPKSIKKEAFQEYRISGLRSRSPLIPFHESLPEDVNPDVQAWKKSVRPSATAYKEFRDESQWQKGKEKFETTIQSQNLYHLIDEDFNPTNKDLDKLQMNWLYKVMQDVFVAGSAKAIVTAHIEDKDTRAIWKEICETLKTNMTSELKSQTILTYLSSTRLNDGKWRGTEEAYVLHYQQQVRLYNEMMGVNGLSDIQSVNMLQVAVSGTDNLKTVLQMQRNSRKAANNNNPITFSEYVALLQLQAQVDDASRKYKTNPTVKREVNMHVFDDCTEAIEESHFEMEANVHDMDTPVEDIMINQTNFGRPSFNNKGKQNSGSNEPKKVYLDRDTWHSLSQSDKDAWDKMSNQAKTKVAEYFEKKRTSQGSITIKSHDFEPTVNKQASSKPASENDKVKPEVVMNTHEFVVKGRVEPTKSKEKVTPTNTTNQVGKGKVTKTELNQDEESRVDFSSSRSSENTYVEIAVLAKNLVHYATQ